jgi:hypothetical protein
LVTGISSEFQNDLRRRRCRQTSQTKPGRNRSNGSRGPQNSDH